MKRSISGLSALLFSSFISVSAFALPIGQDLPLESFRGATAAIRGTDGVNFEGIVALSNCSGSIVRYESSHDDDRAMVFTNGHCNEHGMPDPGTFEINTDSSREFAVLDPKTAERLGNVQAEKILYSTMTKTDITMYRLTSTYREILTRFHIRPLTVSSKQASPGQKIEIISGYWKRGYACAIDHFVDTLKEAGWTMRNSIRYTEPGCEIIGGTSGSPVILAGTDQLVGLNNTTNESGENCTMDNPCEVNKDGSVIAEKGASYGQQVALIYSCLDSEMRLDLKIPTCRLPGGPQSGSATFRRISRQLPARLAR